MVDPSCSGSGIVSRMDNLIDGTEDECKKEVRRIAGANISFFGLKLGLQGV